MISVTKYLEAEGSKQLYEPNLKEIGDVLMNKHGFPLSPGDMDGTRGVFDNYYSFDPAITYKFSLSANTVPEIVAATGGSGGNNGVTCASLIMADDGTGQNRSFLAREFLRHRGP